MHKNSQYLWNVHVKAQPQTLYFEHAVFFFSILLLLSRWNENATNEPTSSTNEGKAKKNTEQQQQQRRRLKTNEPNQTHKLIHEQYIMCIPKIVHLAFQITENIKPTAL